MGTENNTTCAITGYRPTRFKWKYNENDNNCKRLKRRLREQFVELYEQGVRRFLVGGALGVDMWSGEILLKMKLEPEYNDIELIVVLPYPDHDERWDDSPLCGKEKVTYNYNSPRHGYNHYKDINC